MRGAQVRHVPRALLGAFFLIDGLTKIMRPAPLTELIAHLGFAPNLVSLIGVILMSSTVLYLIPRTAVFGAILMTGYFGGALAAHARVADPPITYLAVIIFAILIWAALYPVDARVRAMLGRQ